MNSLKKVQVVQKGTTVTIPLVDSFGTNKHVYAHEYLQVIVSAITFALLMIHERADFVASWVPWIMVLYVLTFLCQWFISVEQKTSVELDNISDDEVIGRLLASRKRMILPGKLILVCNVCLVGVSVSIIFSGVMQYVFAGILNVLFVIPSTFTAFLTLYNSATFIEADGVKLVD